MGLRHRLLGPVADPPARRPARHGARSTQRAFTLVEVLVALFVMAILSAMAWQGLQAVLAAREASREAVDRAGRLSTVLTQWEQDLLALADTGVVPAFSFDGQTLRLTRRTDAGVVLVAWALRPPRWQRWVSPPFTQQAPLQEAWLASQQFQGEERGQLELLDKAEAWQLYVYYDGGWANAQSSGDLAEEPPVLPPPENPPPQNPPPENPPPENPPPQNPPPQNPPAAQRQQLPAAVRLLLTIDGQPLTRDIALAPAG